MPSGQVTWGDRGLQAVASFLSLFLLSIASNGPFCLWQGHQNQKMVLRKVFLICCCWFCFFFSFPLALYSWRSSSQRWAGKCQKGLPCGSLISKSCRSLHCCRTFPLSSLGLCSGFFPMCLLHIFTKNCDSTSLDVKTG